MDQEGIVGGGELLTVEQVVDRLKLHERTIYRWIREGKIPCVKLGNRTVRIDSRDLDALIEARKAQP